MLGIVSMAGNALKAFGNTHPAVKWGVIVLALLLGAEFVGKEGISLYVQLMSARATAEKLQAEGNWECRTKGGCDNIPAQHYERITPKDSASDSATPQPACDPKVFSCRFKDKI